MGEEEKLTRDKIANALNPNSSLDTLRKLAMDESFYVRKAVSENKYCPFDGCIMIGTDISSEK